MHFMVLHVLLLHVHRLLINAMKQKTYTDVNISASLLGRIFGTDKGFRNLEAIKKAES